MRLLFAMLMWLCASTAWAKPIVGALMVQDARGRWVPVTETAEATATRGDQRIPLKISTELEYGDELRTYNARVEIIWTEGEDAEQVYVWEYAQVTLTGERSVMQQMGDLYFQLRNSFSIQYGTVETMVDGTAFTVKGPNPVEVGVTEGVVRVRDGESEERVTAGQFVTAAGGGAGVTAATNWSRSARRAVKANTFMDGFAATELGIMAGGLQLPQSGPVAAQLYGQFRLAKALQLRAESGVLSGDGIQLPQTLELSYRLGGLAVGGRGQVSLYQAQKDCPDGCDASLWGLSASGAGVLRYSVPLSARLVASGDLSAGITAFPDDIQAFGAGRVGIGVAF